MDKMSLSQRSALKATLMRVAALHPGGVLMCGVDQVNKQTFCSLIQLGRNLSKLLACTRIDIKSIGHNPQVEEKFVAWLRSHVRTPSLGPFCNNLLSPHNWLRYNIAPNLHCLHLGIAKVDYYMILTDEHLRFYRSKAFNHAQ